MIGMAMLTAYPRRNLYFTARNNPALPAGRFCNPIAAIFYQQGNAYALRPSRFTSGSSKESPTIPACELLAP